MFIHENLTYSDIFIFHNRTYLCTILVFIIRCLMFGSLFRTSNSEKRTPNSKHQTTNAERRPNKQRICPISR
jgi:hypothetical protein